MARTTDQEKRTREARLLASSPEVVYRELKIYGEDVDSDILAVDEELEKSLLAREDPLIDLALACYATDKSVVGGLYKKGLQKPETWLDGRYRRGLRIACLSNEVISYPEFPTDVIGREETDRIFADADWQEAEALLANPKLDDNLLVTLYQRSDSFATLPDDRWCDLVRMSAKNPRLAARNDTDDYPDTGHLRIQRAIFGLLSIIPTTSKGLHTAACPLP